MLRIAILLCLFLVGLQGLASRPATAEPIRGSGSTFAFPIISKWSQGYQSALAGADFVPNAGGIDYEAIGSQAGFLRLSQPEMDFAATDAPLPPADLKRLGLVQFPIVMGGLAIVINVPGVTSGQMKLSAIALADIFQGNIKRWNDPVIQQLNPELKLPDLAITVVWRSDGSGSTANATRFMSAASERFRTAIGSDTTVKFPVGTGREGSGGVRREVARTSGAISYVEYGQIVRSGLAFALIENRSGRFIAPSPPGFQAAAASATWSASNDFYQFLTEAPAPEAYPLSATTFILMPREGRSQARVRRTLGFFLHALDGGADEAAALDFVPLPPALVQAIKAYWKASFEVSDRFLADPRLLSTR